MSNYYRIDEETSQARNKEGTGEENETETILQSLRPFTKSEKIIRRTLLYPYLSQNPVKQCSS